MFPHIALAGARLSWPVRCTRHAIGLPLNGRVVHGVYEGTLHEHGPRITSLTVPDRGGTRRQLDVDTIPVDAEYQGFDSDAFPTMLGARGMSRAVVFVIPVYKIAGTDSNIVLLVTYDRPVGVFE